MTIYFSEPVPGLKINKTSDDDPIDFSPDAGQPKAAEVENDDVEEEPDPEVQAAPVEEPAEEPEAEDVEEVEEEETEVEEEQVLETAPEEQTSSPRANARIQQLVGEKTVFEQRALQAEQRAAALETKLDSLVAMLEAQATTQKQALERADALERAEREAQERAAEDERIRQLGFDPNDPGLAVWKAMQKRQRELDVELASIKEAEAWRQQQLQQYQTQARVQLYVQQMNESLDKLTKSFNVTPELKQSLRQAAYMQAQVQQIADPAEAAKLAIKLFAPSLKSKKEAKAPPASPEAQKAAALMSVRGATAGKKAGTHTSGRQKPKTVEQIEAELAPEFFG